MIPVEALMASILALMDDPEHYDTQGSSNGYVSVDELRKLLGTTDD